MLLVLKVTHGTSMATAIFGIGGTMTWITAKCHGHHDSKNLSE